MLRSHDSEKPTSQNAVDNVAALQCDFLLWVQRQYVLFLHFYFQVCGEKNRLYLVVLLLTFFFFGKIVRVGSHPYFYTNILLLSFFCGWICRVLCECAIATWCPLKCLTYPDVLFTTVSPLLNFEEVSDWQELLLLILIEIRFFFYLSACRNISHQHIYRVFSFQNSKLFQCCIRCYAMYF